MRADLTDQSQIRCYSSRLWKDSRSTWSLLSTVRVNVKKQNNNNKKTCKAVRSSTEMLIRSSDGHGDLVTDSRSVFQLKGLTTQRKWAWPIISGPWSKMSRWLTLAWQKSMQDHRGQRIRKKCWKNCFFSLCFSKTLWSISNFPLKYYHETQTYKMSFIELITWKTITATF